MDGVDRVSSLPDCLLHHILSFLETKQSFRTSVLSKRWINVWKSVPCLDLDASYFDQIKDFKNFVDSILHHKLFPNPETLDTFNLTWRGIHNEKNYQTITRWIYDIVSLKPRAIRIELSMVDRIYFFMYLLNCSSIESLFLRARSRERFNPTMINLPILKSLHLSSLILEDEFIQRLISGCLILEELVFEDCYFCGTKRISSNTVKKLIISNSEFDFNFTLVTYECGKLRISIPSLIHLVCKVPLGLISFENLESLEFARVTLWNMKHGLWNLRHGQNDEEEVAKLLRGLSNAKIIHLFGSFLGFMLKKEVSVDFPAFEKLESLTFGYVSIYPNLEPINLFLNHARNLEKLTLENIWVIEVKPEITPTEIQCSRRLKTVEIVCPRGNIDELVKRLWDCLKTVQNISIITFDD